MDDPQFLSFSPFISRLGVLGYEVCPPMKCEVNWALSSLKVLIEFGVSLLTQILAAPLSVIGKALHMISSGTP